MKFKKIPLYAAILLFASCGGGGNSQVDAPPEEQVQQIADATTDQPVDASTDTGSTENPIEVAQYAPHPRYQPRYMPTPVIVSLKGENSTQVVQLAINEPPEDINACLQTVVVNTIPVAESEHQYNTWWLIASPTQIFFVPEQYESEEEPRQVQEPKIALYWAKQISEDEVVVIPASNEKPITLEKASNFKINTGFTTLPYMFINRLDVYGSIPKDRTDKCLG